MAVLIYLLAVALLGVDAKRPSEYIDLPWTPVIKSPMPHTYLMSHHVPDEWDWRNVNGRSYVTKMLNQHIPQYCGSCWAHGAVSALADRIKIARGGKGDDINLAIQFILNCGTKVAGSCHGGSHGAAYQFIKETGYIPYDTCLQYEACSTDSTEGTCQFGNYECTAINTCRTCSTFAANGGFCSQIDEFPNATVEEYGHVTGAENMKKEIYARGPIACGVNADEIDDYAGGIVDLPHKSKEIDHIVSVVGWGMDPETKAQYWIVRNSWGQYWGEMGYFRIMMGGNQLGIEGSCVWATPGSFSEVNFPCREDGANCIRNTKYMDPSTHFQLHPHLASVYA